MPAIFSEAVLEQAIIDKFIAEDYEYVSGDDLHRELTDVLIEEDLSAFLAAVMRRRALLAPRSVLSSVPSGTPLRCRYTVPTGVCFSAWSKARPSSAKIVASRTSICACWTSIREITKTSLRSSIR